MFCFILTEFIFLSHLIVLSVVFDRRITVDIRLYDEFEVGFGV